MPSSQLQVSAEAIESAVEIIVDSMTFRSSKQSQMLLRYIVKHSIAGEDNLLRERVIGAEVFNRAPDYDAGNDPVVRARVGELRKRLAHYYQENARELDVLISIPSGSYRAMFTLRESSMPLQSLGETATAEASPAPPPIEPIRNPLLIQAEPAPGVVSSGHAKKTWLITVASILACVAIAAALFWQRTRNVDQSQLLLDWFWAPLVTSGKPAVIYIGGNYAYRLSDSFLEAYRAHQNRPYEGPEFFIDLKDGESIPEREIIPTNNLIGFGDVAASSRIVSTLTRLGAKYDLRYGNDITVTDLRTSPVVLIGGFSNPWAIRLTKNLRFSLESGNKVIDHQDPRRAWPNLNGTPDSPPTDYVVISRLIQSPTGGFTLIVAGVGTVGNQAAADFISDPVSLAKVLKNAPAGWEHMNMQVVLRTNKMNEIPISTEVQATYFW